jgi:tellurite resistance protein TehA-like permease
MVLGILSVVIPYIGLIIGIVGIILSSLSLKEINRHGEQGRGMAIAGLVCSIIGTLIYTLIIIFIVIVFIVAASSGDPDIFSDI